MLWLIFENMCSRFATSGSALTRAQANAALREMLAGEADDDEIAALLTAIAKRGETVSSSPASPRRSASSPSRCR